MNKRIHIGWVVALVSAVIAVQGFAQGRRTPGNDPGPLRLVVTDTGLYRFDMRDGSIQRSKLPESEKRGQWAKLEFFAAE